LSVLYVTPLIAVLIASSSWRLDAYRTNQSEARAYRGAEQALDAGKLLDAESLFVQAGDYSNAAQRAAETKSLIDPYVAKYEDGEAALKSGDFDSAVSLLLPVATALPGYQDVSALLAQARKGQTDAEWDEARRAYAAQDWLRAELLFTKLASESPNDPDVASTLLDLRRDHALFVYTLRTQLVMAIPGQTTPIPLTDAVTASWPVWSPDRSKIAFISPGDQNNGFARGLYIIDPDGSNLKRIADAPIQNQTPVWSPDGKRVAFEVASVTAQHTTMRSSIVVVDIGTGKGMEIADRQLPNASSPTWSPTGDRIAFVSRATEHLKADPSVPDEILRVDRSSVYVYTFATKTTSRVGGDDLPEPYRIAWSPTSEQILVFSRKDGTSFDQGKLYLADVRTNAVTTVDSTNIDVSMPVWSPNGAQFAYVVRTSWIRVVDTDGQSFSLSTRVNLGGGVSWSPSSDRLLAAGSTGVGEAALATIGHDDGSIIEIPLVYDADGGDAGPPDWAGLRGATAPAIGATPGPAATPAG
jgi:Tol biopolymer transport system component